MKVRITSTCVTFPEGRPSKRFGDFDEVEVELESGHKVEFSLKEIGDTLTVQRFVPESPSDFWLTKLAKAIEDGDWRNVDRAITNLRIHHESPNHA